MTADDLNLLVSTLEVGMWDNRLVDSLLVTLDSKPEMLLPHLIGRVGQAAFLLNRVGRAPFALRALFACLAWAIKNNAESEQGPTLITNIEYVLKREGLDLNKDEIRRRAISGEYGDAESWVLRWTPTPSGQASTGIAAAVRSKLPLTTFRGWLKHHEPDVQNAALQSLLGEVFSRFGGEQSRPEEYLEKTERLISCGVRLPQAALNELGQLRELLNEGIQVKMRRHRRYSGGDGRLPRSCYSAVCSDPNGDDGGTLNRELMAYVHPCVPGTVFVGDSSDARMNAVLGDQVGVVPGYCAVYVFLFPPEDPSEREVFNKVYAKTLSFSGGPDAPYHVHVLETRVDPVEIDNVIDLRLPETQAWFFERFRLGDGVHLSKPHGDGITNFHGMLPTLKHPELGGCAVTHGVGSWLRTSHVNALIFPSARSDTTVTMREGQLAGFRGWNMVDYRRAAEIASGEAVVDPDRWYAFGELDKTYGLPSGTLELAPAGSAESGSWTVRGVQTRYDSLYQQLTK
jgi:hypothetical protein